MWPNPQETAYLVTFTDEIIHRKLYFLGSEREVMMYFHNTTFGTLLSIWKAFNIIPISPEKQCFKVMDRETKKERELSTSKLK